MGDIIKMSESNNSNRNKSDSKKYNQDYNGGENINSSSSSSDGLDHLVPSVQEMSVYYNQERVKSVKVQFITNNIQSFELPKDIGTDNLPDFGTFCLTDSEGNKFEKPNVGRVEIKEAEDKLGHIEAIQIIFATEAFFIEDMKLSREFRIPYHAIANIDIEHIIGDHSV
jgi:hypothetical protein